MSPKVAAITARALILFDPAPHVTTDVQPCLIASPSTNSKQRTFEINRHITSFTYSRFYKLIFSFL